MPRSASTTPSIEQPLYKRILATLRAQIAEEALRAAWGAGRLLTLEQALADQRDRPAACFST